MGRGHDPALWEEGGWGFGFAPKLTKKCAWPSPAGCAAGGHGLAPNQLPRGRGCGLALQRERDVAWPQSSWGGLWPGSNLPPTGYWTGIYSGKVPQPVLGEVRLNNCNSPF